MTLLEICGNIFIVLSVFLAAKNNKLTWPIGIIGCTLYGYMFFISKLYADVTLQVFFIGTSIIGLLNWSHKSQTMESLKIGKATLKSLLLVYFPLAVISALIYGFTLHTLTDASLPFIDSVVLTFSVVAQLLLMKRKIENWIFWIVADIFSVPLYAIKGLYLTSFVYAIFLIVACYGWLTWWREFKREHEKI